MISIIRNGTNVEDRRVCGPEDWGASLIDFVDFISFFLVWLENVFDRMLRVFHFFIHSTRSMPLRSDKLALVSNVWNKFFDN